jgi:hydrogenase maturation protease
MPSQLDPPGSAVTTRPGPDSSGPGGPLAVIGIGNILLSDDGLGVAIVERLAQDAAAALDAQEPWLPPDTDLIDGGTGGMTLLPQVAGTRALLIVDAVDFGLEPGSIRILTGDGIGAAYQTHLTAHQVGASDLIAAARLSGVLPAAVALVGMQPGTLETGVGLSPAVAAALPEAVAVVRQWCWRLNDG